MVIFVVLLMVKFGKKTTHEMHETRREQWDSLDINWCSPDF